jgi:hypothetical protein
LSLTSTAEQTPPCRGGMVATSASSQGSKTLNCLTGTPWYTWSVRVSLRLWINPVSTELPSPADPFTACWVPQAWDRAMDAVLLWQAPINAPKWISSATSQRKASPFCHACHGFPDKTKVQMWEQNYSVSKKKRSFCHQKIGVWPSPTIKKCWGSKILYYGAEQLRISIAGCQRLAFSNALIAAEKPSARAPKNGAWEAGMNDWTKSNQRNQNMKWVRC